MYDLEDLSNFVSDQTDNKISFSVNMTTFKTYMTLADCSVDFSHGKLNEILGFESKVYQQSAESEDIINISRGVDRILIRCNLVERKFQPQFRDVLYDVLPVGSPGSSIQQIIDIVEFHDCKDSVVREIEIRLTDQHNNLLEIKEPFILKIVFKY